MAPGGHHGPGLEAQVPRSWSKVTNGTISTSYGVGSLVDLGPAFCRAGGDCQLSVGGSIVALPAPGSVARWMPAALPSLVRGTGPRQPKLDARRNVWPHKGGLPLAEVPVSYPRIPAEPHYLILEDVHEEAAFPQPDATPTLPPLAQQVEGEREVTPLSPPTPTVDFQLPEVEPFPSPSSRSAWAAPLAPKASHFGRRLRGCPLGGGGSPLLGDRGSSSPRCSSSTAGRPVSGEGASSGSRTLLPPVVLGPPPALPQEASELVDPLQALARIAGTTRPVFPGEPPDGSLPPAVLSRVVAQVSRLQAADAQAEWIDGHVASAPFAVHRPRSPPWRWPDAPPPPRGPPRSESDPSLIRRGLRGLARSKCLLGSLYDMRRAGNPRCPPPPEVDIESEGTHHKPPPVPRAADLLQKKLQDGTLIDITVNDCEDTPEQLIKGIEVLLSQFGPCKDLGASRHPTTIVSERTVRVLRRKLAVLSPLVYATRKLEELSTRREEVVEAVLAGADPSEVGGEAMGLSDMLEDCVHPGGDPALADRTKFEHFANTFKLHKNHMALKRAQALIDDQEDAWCNLVAAKARELVDAERADEIDTSAGSEAGEKVMRLFKLAEGIGMPGGNVKMLQTEALAKVARARKVRVNAAAELRRLTQGPTSVPVLFRVAIGTLANIKGAIEWGVDTNHPEIIKAYELSYELQGLAILELIKEERARPKPTYADYAAAAERVETAIRNAIGKYSVPVGHYRLEEARQESLKLREEAGMKRRQENAHRKGGSEAEAAGAG